MNKINKIKIERNLKRIVSASYILLLNRCRGGNLVVHTLIAIRLCVGRYLCMEKVIEY